MDITRRKLLTGALLAPLAAKALPLAAPKAEEEPEEFFFSAGSADFIQPFVAQDFFRTLGILPRWDGRYVHVVIAEGVDDLVEFWRMTTDVYDQIQAEIHVVSLVNCEGGFVSVVNCEDGDWELQEDLLVLVQDTQLARFSDHSPLIREADTVTLLYGTERPHGYLSGAQMKNRFGDPVTRFFLPVGCTVETPRRSAYVAPFKSYPDI